jgi:DNA-binding response OmpR family regulator
LSLIEGIVPKRILIVDDEEDIVSLVRMILEDAGYDVSSAATGREALTRIKSSDYDLILLDIMMPQVSGWDILSELRSNAQTKNIPVALLTARASPRDDNRPHPTDYCDYIIKPFEPEDLLARVRQILSS